MSNTTINQTFIVESINGTEFSACTTLYTNAIVSCSGDTQIFLSEGVITFDGNLYTNEDLSASTINASIYYSGGTNLLDIFNNIGITGGTFDDFTKTLTLFNGNNTEIIVTGFTDNYTTGATVVGNTVYFDRTDLLSAYTFTFSGASYDTYVTGVTFNNNQLIIGRNDGVNLNTFINNFTGLTVAGNFISNSISANTISATTFYGDGSNLTGLVTQDVYVTGGTYSNGIIIFTNNTGNTFSVSGLTLSFTGGTVAGLTATTFSATTYQGLPTDIFTTGGTYSNGSLVLTNNSGGTFSVIGFALPFTGGTVAGLTATTFSATTYQGLPIDIHVTGFDFLITAIMI